METYNDKEKRYETKEEIFNDTDLNVPTNNKFAITAEKIRHTLKSIVESLWRRTYTATGSDLSTAAYVKQSDGSFITIALPHYTVHIPKCNTLIIPKEILDHSKEMMRIEMDNVEDGDELTLICKTKLVGIGSSSDLYGYFRNGSSDSTEIELVKHEINSSTIYIDIDNEKKPLLTYSNIGLTGNYSGVAGDSYLYRGRNTTQYPLHLVYWDGVWYPVNIY